MADASSATLTLPEALKLLVAQKAEAEKMRLSLKFYETENLRLVDEVRSMTATTQSNAGKLANFEKMKQSLQKKILIGEKSLKFEKVATEGLSKKLQLLTAELDEVKGTKANLFEEVLQSRKRIIELEKSLSSGRALRLKEMHENELFKRQIAGLEARMLESEEDNRRAQTSLLNKIQELETAVALNQAQGRTVAAQSEEMVALAREVCALREKQRVLLERTRRLEHVAAVCARERDAFEREVMRLRHPLLANVPPSSQAVGGGMGGMGPELEREMRLFDQQAHELGLDPAFADVTTHTQHGSPTKPKHRATAAYRGAHALARPRVELKGQSIGIGRGKAGETMVGAGSVLSADSVLSLTAPPYIGVTGMEGKVDRTAPHAHADSEAARISTKTVERLAADRRTGTKNGSAHVFMHESTLRALSAEATPHRLSKALAYVDNGGSLSYSSNYLQHPSRYAPITQPSSATTTDAQPTSLQQFADANNATTTFNTASAAMDDVMNVAGADLDPSTYTKRKKAAGAKKFTATVPDSIGTAHGVKPKSMFVGQGLGLRNDPQGKDRFQPTGSAKQVLKQILDEFED